MKIEFSQSNCLNTRIAEIQLQLINFKIVKESFFSRSLVIKVIIEIIMTCGMKRLKVQANLD